MRAPLPQYTYNPYPVKEAEADIKDKFEHKFALLTNYYGTFSGIRNTPDG